MLDENLPTFYIKRSSEKPRFQSTLFFVQGGAEARPVYSLRHLDPSSPTARNRYAVGLYDAFVPDVLYAEVLIVPKWTQPTLSQDAIRANGGVPPPPEPLLPTEFTIQLYNPDQQVLVRHKPKSWNSPPAWEFEMPQQTFRQPSNSALDRTMSDPAASDLTPKLRFNWRKDGKLSKDLGCYLSGKTTSLADGTRKKSKEPDITVAICKGLKEITLYEPNLYRVEMEDFKGLEVVLLLGAVVIRDVYFGYLKECFHVSDPPKPGSPTHDSPTSVVGTGLPVNGHPKTNGVHSGSQASQPQRMQGSQGAAQRPKIEVQPPPPADPRAQWEIDQEARRLKQLAEAEERERRRREKEAEKKTRKLLEAEEKEARRRQAQIDQETERLRKLYGKEEEKARKQQQRQNSRPHPPPGPAQLEPHLPPRPQHRLSVLGTIHGPNSHRPSAPVFSPEPQRPASVVGGLRPPQQQSGSLKERKSIFNLFRKEDERSKTLSKKQSSMF
ncbi:hypothetical protein VTO42DRAFT_286 [Malbranchea cinnamomea]